MLGQNTIHRHETWRRSIRTDGGLVGRLGAIKLLTSHRYAAQDRIEEFPLLEPFFGSVAQPFVTTFDSIRVQASKIIRSLRIRFMNGANFLV